MKLGSFQSVEILCQSQTREFVRARLESLLRDSVGEVEAQVEGFVVWDNFRIWFPRKVFGWQPLSCVGEFIDDDKLRVHFEIGVYPLHYLWGMIGVMFCGSAFGLVENPTLESWVVVAGFSAIAGLTVREVLQIKSRLWSLVLEATRESTE